MSRIITKNCRKCRLPFDQPTLQGFRPTEYCSVRCQQHARRKRNADAMRARYHRAKALGYKPEERIEALDFGA